MPGHRRGDDGVAARRGDRVTAAAAEWLAVARAALRGTSCCSRSSPGCCAAAGRRGWPAPVALAAALVAGRPRARRARGGRRARRRGGGRRAPRGDRHGHAARPRSARRSTCARRCSSRCASARPASWSARARRSGGEPLLLRLPDRSRADRGGRRAGRRRCDVRGPARRAGRLRRGAAPPGRAGGRASSTPRGRPASGAAGSPGRWTASAGGRRPGCARRAAATRRRRCSTGWCSAATTASTRRRKEAFQASGLAHLLAGQRHQRAAAGHARARRSARCSACRCGRGWPPRCVLVALYVPLTGAGPVDPARRA